LKLRAAVARVETAVNGIIRDRAPNTLAERKAEIHPMPMAKAILPGAADQKRRSEISAFSSSRRATSGMHSLAQPYPALAHCLLA
jgi:hypothetical protein